MKSKRSLATVNAIIADIEAGLTILQASRCNGVGYQTLKTWMRDDTKLMADVSRARYARDVEQVENLKRIADGTGGGASRAAVALLQRYEREVYDDDIHGTVDDLQAAVEKLGDAFRERRDRQG